MFSDRVQRAASAASGSSDPDSIAKEGWFITSNMRVKEFQNIHVYEFMCAVLGLTPAKNDGDPAVTRGMLR